MESVQDTKMNMLKYSRIIDYDWFYTNHDNDNKMTWGHNSAAVSLPVTSIPEGQTLNRKIIVLPDYSVVKPIATTTSKPIVNAPESPDPQPSTSAEVPNATSPDREISRATQINEDLDEPANIQRTRLFKRTPVESHTEINTETDTEEDSEPATREIGTQTMHISQLHVIKEMKLTIRQQRAQIDSLKARLQEEQDKKNARKYMIEANDDEDEEDETFDDNQTENVRVITKTPKRGRAKTTQVLAERNTNGNDMVPIGAGKAKIPARIFKYINWKSYTSATRKLLTAVFSRRVLATHSLSGKRSPAFQSKPHKKKLDSDLVNDIVQTVMERCHVPENVVRSSITSKCADESKMLRNKIKTKRRYNKENSPVYASDDTESDTA